MRDYQGQFFDVGEKDADELVYGFTKEDWAALAQTIEETREILRFRQPANLKEIYSLIETWEEVYVQLTDSHVSDQVEEVVETLDQIFNKEPLGPKDRERARDALREFALAFGVKGLRDLSEMSQREEGI